MIAGYILVGTLAGLLASLVALLFGSSYMLAFGLYCLVSPFISIFLPLARMGVHTLIHAQNDQSTVDYLNEVNISSTTKFVPNPMGPVVKKPMRILAVDDDSFILDIIPVISAKAGFTEVTIATSGEEALGMLADPNMGFDCLLFDISMPSMDGIELCRHTRQLDRYSRTPILMLTAMRDMKNMGDAFRAGATDYVTKPFDIEELSARLSLAQEVNYTNWKAGSGSQQSLGYDVVDTSSDSFALLDGIRPQGVRSLVDLTVLSNYLTQLPRKVVADIQVFAVRIDGIEADQTRPAPQNLISLRENVAVASATCFGADQTVMAYTNDATLLIVTNSANLSLANNIESDIEKLLQGSSQEHGAGERLGVSVGGPIRPQSEKEERAKVAFDLVMSLPENKANKVDAGLLLVG
jgi:DNA-binding response OmpR family regulator